MKSAGVVLIVIGMLMAFGAFNMDTSVSSFDGNSVNNLGLLQQQMMVLQTGLASFIAGAVLYGCGAIASPSQSLAVSPVVRANETDEAREERLQGVRKLNRIMGVVVLVVFVLLMIAAAIATSTGI
jgi:hypothetical protein